MAFLNTLGAASFRNIRHHFFSTLQLPDLVQGSSIFIKSSNTNVVIQSAWREDGTATLDTDVAKMSLSVEPLHTTSMGKALPKSLLEIVVDDKTKPAKPANLTLQVPEKANIDCELDDGSISVHGKIEGDVHLSTTKGDIRVSKLRGHHVSLLTDSVVHVADLLEAEHVRVEGGRIRVKQIHGRNVRLTVDGFKSPSDNILQEDVLETDDEGSCVDVSALFIAGQGGSATIAVSNQSLLQRRAVRIKSHHGAVRVQTENVSCPRQVDPLQGRLYPIVDLGGVNGQYEVEMLKTTGMPDEGSWESCQVHIDSLSPDSVSLATVDQGVVSLTMDRKVQADLRMLATNTSQKEIGAILADEENDQAVLHYVETMPQLQGTHEELRIGDICVQTAAFTATSPESSNKYVTGYMENKSQEPDSRFDRKAQTGSAGKIRIDSAADQALNGFSSNVGFSGFRPLVATVCKDGIQLETVSWLGAIARRYGLDDSSEQRTLGRTASRRGRELVPLDEDRQ